MLVKLYTILICKNQS